MAVTYKVPQIKNGDKGIAVVIFQGIMKYRINGMSGRPFYEGEIDGEFGPQTEKAARRYQNVMHEMGYDFSVDGIVGNQTWESILGGLQRV